MYEKVTVHDLHDLKVSIGTTCNAEVQRWLVVGAPGSIYQVFNEGSHEPFQNLIQTMILRSKGKRDNSLECTAKQSIWLPFKSGARDAWVSDVLTGRNREKRIVINPSVQVASSDWVQESYIEASIRKMKGFPRPDMTL